MERGLQIIHRRSSSEHFRYTHWFSAGGIWEPVIFTAPQG